MQNQKNSSKIRLKSCISLKPSASCTENSSCIYPDVIATVNWGSERVGARHEQLSIGISLCGLHNMAGVSIFKDVPLVPLDHVFKVNNSYNEDKDPRKVNMGIGGKNLDKSWLKKMSERELPIYNLCNLSAELCSRFSGYFSLS